MLEDRTFEGELSFLNHINPRRTSVYRNAQWLQSDFLADKWVVRFEHLTTLRTIDFSVRMSDGLLLTHHRHSELLMTLKEWLCACTHPHATAARPIRSSTMQARVNCTLHLIDYLLLRQDKLSLCSYGLAVLTENDFKVLISRLASANDVAESVYEWTFKLRDYLLENAQNISAGDIADACQDIPTIDVGLDRGGDLQLSTTELLAARAWIWREGLYERKSQGGFKYVPNVTELASRIYMNTLWGSQTRNIPQELRLPQDRLAERERKAVPVRSENNQSAGDRTIALYMRCLSYLKLVARGGHAVPASALDSILDRNPYSWLQLNDVGRFQTLPQDVVLFALQRSASFALEYGDAIVAAYSALATEAQKIQCSIAEVERKRGIQDLLPQNLLDIGIKRWRITVGAKDSGDYYKRLRNNEGLSELVMILVGSVFVITGATTARRNGELTELRVGDCVDDSGRHLIFENRKSGVGETRQREERPVPALVVRLIRLLERLHSSVLDTRSAASGKFLFAYPSRINGALTDGAGVYFCVDLLCDYFEIPGDSPNTRHYLRQHQLRRFFAISFFWGSGFGGLDTLRWFLGQSDPKHIWRYILESVPGKILTSVRTRYATQALLSSSSAAEALADIVEQKFGTRQFSVLNVLELEEYIEVLLEDSQLVIEPQFFESDSGTIYRIAILVTEQKAADD